MARRVANASGQQVERVVRDDAGFMAQRVPLRSQQATGGLRVVMKVVALACRNGEPALRVGR